MELQEECNHLLPMNREETYLPASYKGGHPGTKVPLRSRILTFFAVISVLSNLFLVSHIVFTPNSCLTTVGKLQWDKQDTLWWNTEYSNSTSEAYTDDLWDKHIPWERGIIAIENGEAKGMGLPDSQPFPWDATKSIYILNSYHILHCVRNVYISIQEYRRNQPQSITYEHILHCLDSIRLETLCTADDTPRYVPHNQVTGFRPGDGQTRMCRDWQKLETFVNDHSPCYREISHTDKHISNLDRFKYCPNDSPYLPIIRNYFGYDEEWVPWPDSD